MRLAGNIIDTMLNATGLAHKRMIEVMTGKRTDAVIREELPLIEDISQHPLHLLARRNRQEPMSVEAFPVVVLAVADPISYCQHHDGKRLHGHRLLAIPSREKMERVLRYVLDEREFLSDYGIRALSRHHLDHPFVCKAGGIEHRVDYVPGESHSSLFGGNSNWRGPVWFPVNYLLIEALERYHHFYGDSFQVEYPTGSGRRLTLQ